MCQKNSVCYPVNSTTGICRSKADIKGTYVVLIHATN